MNVYLFSDYLNSNELGDDFIVCRIEEIKSFPRGLIKVQGKLARACMISTDGLYIEYIEEPQRDDEVFASYDITCPHCGEFNSDSWECDDSDENVLCGTCGSTFSYTREVEVTYNSTIVKRNEIITELK